MRHSYFGRKLSRTKNERRGLFMILARELIEHGQIRTTLAKAKAVQPIVEKLITLAKKGNDAQKRRAFTVLADGALVKQLFNDAKSRFVPRTSGFTSIVKLGPRRGDAAEEVMLSFVDAPVATGTVVSETKKEEKPSKKETKKAGKETKTKSKRVKKLL